MKPWSAFFRRSSGAALLSLFLLSFSSPSLGIWPSQCSSPNSIDYAFYENAGSESDTGMKSFGIRVTTKSTVTSEGLIDSALTPRRQIQSTFFLSSIGAFTSIRIPHSLTEVTVVGTLPMVISTHNGEIFANIPTSSRLYSNEKPRLKLGRLLPNGEVTGSVEAPFWFSYEPANEVIHRAIMAKFALVCVVFGRSGGISRVYTHSNQESQPPSDINVLPLAVHYYPRPKN